MFFRGSGSPRQRSCSVCSSYTLPQGPALRLRATKDACSWNFNWQAGSSGRGSPTLRKARSNAECTTSHIQAPKEGWPSSVQRFPQRLRGLSLPVTPGIGQRNFESPDQPLCVAGQVVAQAAEERGWRVIKCEEKALQL